MGMSHTVYLGPYVECRTQDIEVDAKMRSCTRGSTCSQHEREVHDRQRKFCPQCGSPIGEITYKTKEKNVKAHYLREEIKEALANLGQGSTLFHGRSNDGLDTWISNYRAGTPEGRDYSPNSECVFEVNEDMIEGDLGHFRNFYKETLAIFEEKYGKGNVAVKWGLIQYWS